MLLTSFLRIHFLFIYVSVGVPVVVGIHKGQRCLISLELELQVVVSHSVWVLRIKQVL